jgi:[protein-PII] uridylyltransferase
VTDAGALLASIRCFLHYRAGSDSNVLDFNSQTAFSEQHFAPARTPVACMREYFEHARVLFREAQSGMERSAKSTGPLLEQHREMQSRFSNSEFTVLRERVFLRQPAALAADPGMVFRLLEFVAKHGIPAAADTERRLAADRDSLAAYCAHTKPLWPQLKAVLSHAHASSAIQLLRNTGLMTTLFPEFANIEGLALPDPGHRFTVDEHTFLTIDRIAGQPVAEPGTQRFSDLRPEIDDQAVVLFALLFHEMGKGLETDWISKSAELARNAALRLGMPASDQEDVEFLIGCQYDLSEVVAGRDPDDPSTAKWLANRIGTIERLKMLTLFTYADVAVTSPNAMTPWRLEQLWVTFEMAQGEFTRQLETDRIVELPQHLSQWSEFIQGFPGRYLRARSAAEIERHTRLYDRSRADQAAVELDRIEGAYRLTVIARDMPGLFASFAGAISSFGLDILKAEAFSNSHGVILDTFVIADPSRRLERDPPEAERLQDLIRRVALGKTDATRLLRNRARADSAKRAFPPQVGFDSEACDTATLVEIVTEDRPGLLYSLATAFSSTGCNIDIVLIDTKGHRAIDVFYVAREGGKLTPEFQTTLREKLLAAC